MSSLEGARVALLEGRMPRELADLVRRHGGVAHCVPAVRETPAEDAARVVAFLDDLAAGAFMAVVCLTGAGVKALFEAAERLARLPELLDALGTTTIVCRGPKPTAVFQQAGVPVALRAGAPYTSSEVLDVMAGLALDGARVALIHYGERNAMLAEVLRDRGAKVDELLLYTWQLPEDLGGLQSLVRELLDGQVEAIAFTGQIQVRHLFQMADDLGKREELVHALNNTIVVASVGPVCTAALEEYGVKPAVVPEHPKMGAMVASLARFVAQRPNSRSQP